MSALATPLSPVGFLARSAEVHPAKTAVIDGPRSWTYREFAEQVTRITHALRASGIGPGDRVAYLCSNSAEMLAAHFAVPLARAVIVAINTRLSPNEIAYICDHSGATLLVADTDLIEPVLAAGVTLGEVREIIETPNLDGTQHGLARTTAYGEFLDRGGDEPLDWGVDDEQRTIAINYTSGTTGRPKGVMYSHRGAHLNALGEIYHQQLDVHTRYLWTLPMFHCNGWCLTWAVTAAAGTHVCLRAVRGPDMWRLIDEERIDHFSGAATVLTTLASAAQAHPFPRPTVIVTGGAPPSPTIIARIRELGATLNHVYGLTETYGPYSLCEEKPEWAGLPVDEQARLLARQGVGMLTADRLRVVRADPDEDGELVDVAADATEMGEIVMHGNTVMDGYYRDETATADAFAGGWFHSGDLGVMHPDGYVQLLDRAKDVVVSGGENISTVEVEQALLSHPAVIDAAVIGIPDDKWGERPKAFVVLHPHSPTDSTDLTAHVKAHIAAYKAPSVIEICPDLPKTSTGKTRKNELRDREWHGSTVKING